MVDTQVKERPDKNDTEVSSEEPSISNDIIH